MRFCCSNFRSVGLGSCFCVRRHSGRVVFNIPAATHCASRAPFERARVQHIRCRRACRGGSCRKPKTHGGLRRAWHFRHRRRGHRLLLRLKHGERAHTPVGFGAHV